MSVHLFLSDYYNLIIIFYFIEVAPFNKSKRALLLLSFVIRDGTCHIYHTIHLTKASVPHI
jgi:hypothetical protein